jgi:MFS family permease
MKQGRNGIPRGVWLLGLVSLCMDLSSEMIHSLLPVFLVSGLGAGAIWLGVIEGIAEATASISKVFSGVLSDAIGRRKPLVVAGYGLAALTKPLFPLATSAGWVLVARFVDRIGKGIRGAPRDALVADITPAAIRGAAYGLRQALDTAGALLGPLVALLLINMFSGNVRAVFWVAAVPAIAAVAVLVIFVREPEEHAARSNQSAKLHWRELRQLSGSFWFVVTIGAVFSLARFSEAFLVLRANDVGLAENWTPLALAVMNVAYVVSAYPFGRMADRVDRVWLLAGGATVLAVADLSLALGDSLSVILVGVGIWGIHMGMTHGVLAAMVAGAAPKELRGSAFGVFNFVSGIAMLISSVLAGALWQWYGPRWTFLVGAGLSAVTLAGLAWWRLQFEQKERR